MSSASSDGSDAASAPRKAIGQGQQLELTIEKIASQGQGMATVEGMPIFIPGVIPGQKVQVVITKVKDRYAEGRLLKILKPAVGEIQPKCKHFWDCGGCVWQNLSYDKQITYKEEIVKELPFMDSGDNLPSRALWLISPNSPAKSNKPF